MDIWCDFNKDEPHIEDGVATFKVIASCMYWDEVKTKKKPHHGRPHRQYHSRPQRGRRRRSPPRFREPLKEDTRWGDVIVGPWPIIPSRTPSPLSDWSTNKSPERKPEIPQQTQIAFPQRKPEIQPKQQVQTAFPEIFPERQIRLITPEQEPEFPPERQVQLVTPVPSPTSSLKDFAAHDDEEVAAFNNLFPPQEYEGIKDVAFKTNPRACDNAIKRLKALAFSAGGLMASEQQLKLEELLHLFRMESQDIFEKTWRTPLALPFQDPQRKYFTHLVNTGLFKQNNLPTTTNSTATSADTVYLNYIMGVATLTNSLIAYIASVVGQ